MSPLQAQDADAQLATFFRDYLERRFQLEPLEATQLGVHRFDDQLEDVSPASRAKWTDLTRTTLAQLPQVDYAKLTRAGQIDYEILQNDLKKSLWLAENTRPFEDDPRVYGDYLSLSVYLLLSQSTLPRETNLTNAIARMKRIPAIIEVAQQTLKNPPKSIVETAILQNRGAIGLYESGVFEMAGDSPQLPELRKAAAVVAEKLRLYQLFLERDLLPRANGDWRLGRERFAQKLELVLGANRTADEVLADAEAEFLRVHRELYVVARQLWSRYFPNQALPPDDEAGRHQTVSLVIDAVNREHGTPETLVKDARATVDRIKTFIREKDILRLPEPDRCEVIEMPEFKRGNSLAYLQSAPPLEPAADSFYAISPPPSGWSAERVRSFLEEYNTHMLQILTIHEAYPGHYVQLEYSNRSPSLIRRVLQSGVFIEGWAVYSEQMMLDQGYSEGDLRVRLMQLKFYLRAVVNAILDNRMHCTSMTDDEALHLLVHGGFQEEGEARLKIIRAKQSSTQLSTYFVGRMAHARVRQEIQRELGDQFQLGRYHEAVLDHGSVPTKYLPELVRERLKQPR
ncbi:MAG: DUF885 domain-containing protein [Verrucomicrobia bacterium]|nr:DUF885 domain-containing protein [Verrucomicrobiota bacterium]